MAAECKHFVAKHPIFLVVYAVLYLFIQHTSAKNVLIIVGKVFMPQYKISVYFAFYW